MNHIIMANKLSGMGMLKNALGKKGKPNFMSSLKGKKKKRKGVGLSEASASVQGEQKETSPQETMRSQTQKFKKMACKRSHKHTKACRGKRLK